MTITPPSSLCEDGGFFSSISISPFVYHVRQAPIIGHEERLKSTEPNKELT